MKRYESHSLEDTRHIAEEWLTDLAATLQLQGEKDEATLVGLHGHLGAGKTAFVKCIARILGIKEEVTSPTFVIMKIYESNSQFPWKRLVHIDAYRLERREELEAIDFEKLMNDPANLILIEWPEQVGLAEFDRKQHLAFEASDSGHHTVTVS